MTTVNQDKPLSKRRKVRKSLTFNDVLAASRGGEAVFEFFIKNGSLPRT